MSQYIFNNAVEPTTAERFDTLDSIYNPRSCRFLEATGITLGWHCLEIGGGSGTLGAWMAERVGPTGYVVVTDIDPRFMEASRLRAMSNVSLQRHDVGCDALPDASYDLIHARLVLLHVPQRHEALRRMVRALKPGGWLVVEDFDARFIDRALPIENESIARCYRTMVQALGQLMDERGFDSDWPRRLPIHLQASGLVEVSMEAHFTMYGYGNQGLRLDSVNFAQVGQEAVSKGLIAQKDFESVLAHLDAQGFATYSPVMFSASGRRRP